MYVFTGNPSTSFRKKIRDKVDTIETEDAALTTVESILKYTYSF